MPVPGIDTLFVYDVVHQWREMTGKPAVLAIWAGRRDKITPEVVADFQASKAFGLEHIHDIAEGAALKLELPPCPLAKYLRQNIQFDLDEEKLAGLRLFYEMAAEDGLILAASAHRICGSVRRYDRSQARLSAAVARFFAQPDSRDLRVN